MLSRINPDLQSTQVRPLCHTQAYIIHRINIPILLLALLHLPSIPPSIPSWIHLTSPPGHLHRPLPRACAPNHERCCPHGQVHQDHYRVRDQGRQRAARVAQGQRAPRRGHTRDDGVVLAEAGEWDRGGLSLFHARCILNARLNLIVCACTYAAATNSAQIINKDTIKVFVVDEADQMIAQDGLGDHTTRVKRCVLLSATSPSPSSSLSLPPSFLSPFPLSSSLSSTTPN